MAADELECAVSGSIPLFEPSLPAGTYVVTVGATSPIDATFVVQTRAPTPAPADQTCDGAAAPSSPRTRRSRSTCRTTKMRSRTAASRADRTPAYDLSLASASDVLLVARIPETEQGAVSFDTPACSATTGLACTVATTPLRAGVRNVPTGDYRVVVADELGLTGTLQALFRHTIAPTIVPAGGADTCAAAVDASSGGFFTGDTSTAQPNYGEPCDAPGQPTGGAPDQVLALNLTQPQRVVLDMEGSIYTTVLDVEQGLGSCPGTADHQRLLRRLRRAAELPRCRARRGPVLDRRRRLRGRRRSVGPGRPGSTAVMT